MLPRNVSLFNCASRFCHPPQHNLVILSEAKNLSSIAVVKEGFFASLRMTQYMKGPGLDLSQHISVQPAPYSTGRTGGCVCA
jgi:hypothetical protein